MREINFIVFYLLLSTIVAQNQQFDVDVRPSCIDANKTICVDSLTSTIHFLTTKGWIQQSDDTVVLRNSDDPFIIYNLILSKLNFHSMAIYNGWYKCFG